MKKKTAVIFDIDGVLAKSRDSELKAGRQSLEEYEKGYIEAEVNPWAIDLATALHHSGAHIVVATARSPKCRGDTERWLNEYGVPFNELFMRKEDDRRPSWILKKEMLEDIRSRYNVLFAIDDLTSVCDMYRSEGVVALDAAGEIEGKF